MGLKSKGGSYSIKRKPLLFTLTATREVKAGGLRPIASLGKSITPYIKNKLKEHKEPGCDSNGTALA
jgi:hypothetical protein